LNFIANKDDMANSSEVSDERICRVIEKGIYKIQKSARKKKL
jgi:hypothetical protein